MAVDKTNPHKPRPITLSRFTPGYRKRAEANIVHALKLEQDGNWADALQWLCKALDEDPKLDHDPGVLALAARLTKINPSHRALELLIHPIYRAQLIRRLTPKPPRTFHFPLARAMVFLALFLLVAYTYVAEDGKTIFNGVFSDLQLQHWKSNLRMVNALPYYVIEPNATFPEEGWPTLIIFHGENNTSDDLLSLFADVAYQKNILLVVPDIAQYEKPYRETTTPMIHDLIQAINAEYRVHRDGIILFGHDTGGEVVSRYVRDEPNILAGAVMFGAPYVYPPPQQRPTIPYTLIYGGLDPLLGNSSDTYVQFTDAKDWTTPLNYLVVPELGHDLNPYLVSLTLNSMSDIYGLSFE